MPYKLVPASDDAPERWETGTQNHEGLAGLSAAVAYLAELGIEGRSRREQLASGYAAIADHEGGLARRFLEGLETLPHVRLWGIRDRARLDERTPTFAVRVGSQHPAETAKALAARGIFVWDGDYYAREVMTRLGLLDTGGAVRIGFCHYHLPSEVDRILDALRELA
jgi:selenocysteine lyase/cysteine desulfurase